MNKVASIPAVVWAMFAVFALYGSTHDVWLGMALYFGLISLNVAAHSAARALVEAGRPERGDEPAAPRRRGAKEVAR